MDQSKQDPGPQRSQAEEQKIISEKLSGIKHKIIVLSGKGGVGKSTVSVNLAAALAKGGAKVGLMDVDIHGPTIPRMLGLDKRGVEADERGIRPAEAAAGMKVISLGFFLQDDSDAVIWRGPLKMGAIKQFITDVNWGELDYLVVDCPPGTGDEPLSIAQLLGPGTSAVIVTTPQAVAVQAVRRSVSFARKLELDVLGVIENMSGYLCPHCEKASEPFGTRGGETLAEETDVPFLGRIPLSPEVVPAGDAGRAVALEEGSAVGKIYREIAGKVESSFKEEK